eukprot:CAMPEP_0168626300 /NCGR_PEP_ID=MMETSP0449_2-20121227/10548_1 /TAXON_ID=1082188 /ORGANISM="Strombidium rassoulzadegani, Strain ras09" /LENGTH=49 /DNA_ID=CAMNT_0008668265 /DNA_START=113 /DNA_END=262 /DNA_ORIENTATION=-
MNEEPRQELIKQTSDFEEVSHNLEIKQMRILDQREQDRQDSKFSKRSVR